MTLIGCPCSSDRLYLRFDEDHGYHVLCRGCGRSGPYEARRETAIISWNFKFWPVDKNNLTAWIDSM